MRAVIWFVLLFVVAVVAATTLGGNDGLVSIYWAGHRLDLSLNLFLILLAALCFVLVTVFNGINALIGLPRRAREPSPRRISQITGTSKTRSRRMGASQAQRLQARPGRAAQRVRPTGTLQRT